MIFTGYWEVLVLNFSMMGNTVFSSVKMLMERWYICMVFLSLGNMVFRTVKVYKYKVPSISTHPFLMFPFFFQKCLNPQVSVVYHPCLLRLASRLTLTFIRHLTLINSNLIKHSKISLLFRARFKQFHVFTAYSKLQCVFILYVHFSLL